MYLTMICSRGISNVIWTKGKNNANSQKQNMKKNMLNHFQRESTAFETAIEASSRKNNPLRGSIARSSCNECYSNDTSKYEIGRSD